VVKESTISLEYTRILAPEDGVVLKRFVEPGDLALPGKPLVALRTSGALRLEAYVREGIDHPGDPGNRPEVDIETLDQPWTPRRRNCPLCRPQLTHLSGESGHAARRGPLSRHVRQA
jgi:hypothetical protein